jgi:cell division protein FtsB
LWVGWRIRGRRGEAARVAKRTRTTRRSRFALRWLAVGAILLVGLLYARPLRSYLSTKHDLARRAADVRALKSERRALQHRLAESSSAEALTKQARRLGLVRPGERLYIVKGVSAWLHGTTIERGGR